LPPPYASQCERARSAHFADLGAQVAEHRLVHLGRPYLPAPDGVAITQADYRWLSLGPRHPRAVVAGARVAGRAAWARLLGRRMLSLRQALAASLFTS
jgi:3-oxosteroid 1-dehydrogenase